MRIYKSEVEGGCGVVGFASTIPVRGKHVFEPSILMHNRVTEREEVSRQLVSHTKTSRFQSQY